MVEEEKGGQGIVGRSGKKAMRSIGREMLMMDYRIIELHNYTIIQRI